MIVLTVTKDGITAPIPAADLEWFLSQGWKEVKPEQEAKKETKKNKNK